MAYYVAVNEDRSEHLFAKYPQRSNSKFHSHLMNRNQWELHGTLGGRCRLDKGTIKSMLGVELTWKDEPKKVTLEEVDLLIKSE